MKEFITTDEAVFYYEGGSSSYQNNRIRFNIPLGSYETRSSEHNNDWYGEPDGYYNHSLGNVEFRGLEAIGLVHGEEEESSYEDDWSDEYPEDDGYPESPYVTTEDAKFFVNGVQNPLGLFRFNKESGNYEVKPIFKDDWEVSLHHDSFTHETNGVVYKGFEVVEKESENPPKASKSLEDLGVTLTPWETLNAWVVSKSQGQWQLGYAGNNGDELNLEGANGSWGDFDILPVRTMDNVELFLNDVKAFLKIWGYDS